MKKLLVVVDMQYDFIDGALGSPEAQAIVPNVVKKIETWDGDIIATLDTHDKNYLSTREGKHLPVKHCIYGSRGHEVHHEVKMAMLSHIGYVGKIEKKTFGSTSLPIEVEEAGYEYVEFIGLCTDICVVSNALIIKALHPDLSLTVRKELCAGTTQENHDSAISVMACCQVKIV